MSASNRIELPVEGMDCAECAHSVQEALTDLPGVRSAEVLLAGERAMVELDPEQPADNDELRRAVEQVGYRVPQQDIDGRDGQDPEGNDGGIGEGLTRRVLWLFGLIFGTVLLVVVIGEWMGLLTSLTEEVPSWAGALLVGLLGYPVFAQVVRAALEGRIIAHTLMAAGALTALAAGEWITAGIVVFFMRVGDYVEQFTTDRARGAVRSLTELAPQTARVERGKETREVPVEEIEPGDVVQVRPGERIPVDGTVVGGQARVDQATVTGEPVPVAAREGTEVFASTIPEGGMLRVRASAVGRDSTFGRVIRMVEEAEARRGKVQRLADRFSTYYLPVVALVAIGTYTLSGDLMATVAVMVVACSCAFALATPVAVLASVGAAARRGLLIKGGKYLEALARADVLLLDKTGTLTMGRPEITDVVALDGLAENEVLALAAAAETHSEHPLAEAVRRAARERDLRTSVVTDFEAVPGRGIRATVAGRTVIVGSADMVDGPEPRRADRNWEKAVLTLREEGKSLLFVEVDGALAGLLAAADPERSEVPQALKAVRRYGIEKIELLTGDHEQAARSLAGRLGLDYRAELLPEEKIAIVKQYQREGRTVVMIGDGVNDAPALAQADVGIAMGAAGSYVAIEAAHVALMREDWNLVPELFEITRRTMQVIYLNIGFTAVYNLAGLSLAAFGVLPPVFAAAAQSLPDLGIMANSARLIRLR